MSKTNRKREPDSLTPQEQKAIEEDLRHFGYLLPTTDEELEAFEQIYGTTQVIFPEHLKDPQFLFAKSKHINYNDRVHLKKVSGISKNESVGNKKSDYFKKIVLAAEIANELHDEPTFGHKKFVKIQFLCEEVCNMELSTNYKKYAAGPLDAKQMYTIDAEFKRQKWFQAVPRQNFGFKYKPLENVENYKKYYSRYYRGQAEKIEIIINLFRKQKSDFCEIIATLYAVWKELSEEKTTIADSVLIKKFYDWHEQKHKFKKTELNTAIQWMKENKIVPQKTI